LIIAIDRQRTTKDTVVVHTAKRLAASGPTVATRRARTWCGR
jgi:hypothetical protein